MMTFPPKLAAGLATLTLTLAPISAQAQGSAPANPLGIPDNVVLLGSTDPNVRKPTAVVNGSIITGTDVDQRVALLVEASGGELPEEELQRVRMQVLRNLIDETLQIQEAISQEMEVTDQEVDQRYRQVASQNFGNNTDAMDAYLLSIGSSPASLKRQIRGELAWQNILRRNVTPFINVSEEEVREEIVRIEADRGTEEYRIREIFLPATPETIEQTQANANQIVAQLQQGGSFQAYARQFSQASTAAVGGDLDFVRLAQLPPQIANELRQMQPGMLTNPIAIPGGFSIIYLVDKRQVLMADPRDAVLTLKQISIAFDPGVTEDAANAKIEQFDAAVRAMRGCGDADESAAAIGAMVAGNDIRVRDLPEQLQSAMLSLQVGQATPPFGSLADGVRVLMLCGRDDPDPVGQVDFEAVMAQKEEERIGKRAQRYLRDLRNDAYIEYN